MFSSFAEGVLGGINQGTSALSPEILVTLPSCTMPCGHAMWALASVCVVLW